MSFIFFVVVVLLAACGGAPRHRGMDPGMLAAFQELPARFESTRNPITPEKVALGRALFHDARLSAGDDVSCATCHPLNHYGVDGKPVSTGHLGAKGTRNSPTVYNAAGQFAQFWDGRAATVEEQAEGPILNPVEMAMESAQAVETALRGVPTYRALFAKAFPGEAEPVTFANAARAIGAFERTLTTPAPWDRFLAGDDNALTPAEKAGFQTFTSIGCVTCHRGALVGGEMFNRLGAEKPWPDRGDLGRYLISGVERDRMVFKVPPLRNVVRTAPYFHNGSVETVEEAVHQMAEYQLGENLSPAEVTSIVTWLGSLTGTI